MSLSVCSLLGYELLKVAVVVSVRWGGCEDQGWLDYGEGVWND